MTTNRKRSHPYLSIFLLHLFRSTFLIPSLPLLFVTEGWCLQKIAGHESHFAPPQCDIQRVFPLLRLVFDGLHVTSGGVDGKADLEEMETNEDNGGFGSYINQQGQS